jgi:hypothetical protein
LLDRWLALGCASVGVIIALGPHTPIFIIGGLLFAFLLLWHPAWSSWGLESKKWRFLFLPIQAIFFIAFGYVIWPRLVITPASVHFVANTSQQYDFAITNQTENDAYEISVPIDVQGQPEDNFSLYLWPSVEDRRSVSLAPENANEYSYCLDKSNKPFILANVTHLEPHQVQRLTLIHKAGPSLIAKVGTPLKLDTPMAYDKHVNADGTLSETGGFYVPAAYHCHVQFQPRQQAR